MKIYVKKTISGLVPASRNEFDKLQDAKLKMGEFYEVEIKKKRNVKFHRKLFALFNICFENQEQFETLEDLRAWITIKAGYYKEIKTPTGVFYMPKSISFSKMDDIEFEEYYNKCIIVVMKFIGVERMELIEEINQF